MKKRIMGNLPCLLGRNATALGNSWLKDAVFYEVFVRSFYDSDGDGIGDFKGLEMKLDYIEQLGANALWLMPIFKSPSYHGYDTVDYYRVNKDYGTMEDFDSLLAEANKRNIRIILDLAVNHTSSRHPWFQKSVNNVAPYNDWYIWKKTRPAGKCSNNLRHRLKGRLSYLLYVELTIIPNAHTTRTKQCSIQPLGKGDYLQLALSLISLDVVKKRVPVTFGNV